MQNCQNVITVCFYITYISIYNLREDTNLNTIKQKITQIIHDKPLLVLHFELRVHLNKTHTTTSLSKIVALQTYKPTCAKYIMKYNDTH